VALGRRHSMDLLLDLLEVLGVIPDMGGDV
jgi:hypothetical protein